MRPDEEQYIDALARQRNREDGHGGEGVALSITLGACCWIAILIIALRVFWWWAA